MTKQMKAPVSVRAVIQRINRRLAADRSQLKAGRGRYKDELGYYVVDGWNNIVAYHVDLIAMAKDLECLGLAEEIRND